MKILHLTEFYAPVGGLERYLLALCEACEAAGHTSVVAYGTAIGREPDGRRLVHHLPGLAGPSPAPADTLARLRSLLQAEPPTLVMAHEILDPAVIRLSTEFAPLIRFVHGHKMVCPGGRRQSARSGTVCWRPAGWACQVIAYLKHCMPRDPRQGLPLIARTLGLGALHRTHGELMVPSVFVRELLLRNGFEDRRVHVTPYFTEIPARPPAGSRAVPGQLFCAARLTPEKGVDHALRALTALPPPAHLVVAGEGPARRNLEDLTMRLGLRDKVCFAGWLSRPAMDEAIEASCAVIVPSVWPETFGIVGIEAMAHSRPVVAYDIGGIREWLQPETTGVLVAPGDIEGLTRALQALLRDPERRQAFGSAGRRVVEERFLPEHHLGAFHRVAAAARTNWDAERPLSPESKRG